jgi:hypothetical protein
VGSKKYSRDVGTRVCFCSDRNDPTEGEKLMKQEMEGEFTVVSLTRENEGDLKKLT